MRALNSVASGVGNSGRGEVVGLLMKGGAVCVFSALVALSMGGCGSETVGSSGPSSDEDDPLADRTYIAINLEGAGAAALPGLSELTMAFDGDGHIEATVGCSTIRGDYGFDGYTLEVTSLTSTNADCADLEEEDRWIQDILSAPRHPAYASEGGLAFEEGDVVIELMEAEALAAQPPLVETTWEARGFFSGDQFNPADVDEPGHLRLLDDGTYEAFDGCTTFTGTYQLIDVDPVDRVDFSPPPSSALPPPTTTSTTTVPAPAVAVVPATPDDGCGQYRTAMQAIFGPDASYIARGQRLNVFADGGGIHFEAAS